MGNRATVVFTDGLDFSPAVYLHWNGGPESVYSFLEELDRRECRADQEYECARFIQLVGEFFDLDGQGCLNLGVQNCPSDVFAYLDQLDPGDNGVYLVNRTTTPTQVRRYVHNFPGETVEMSPEAVELERLEAEVHPYRETFRAGFALVADRRALTAAGN